MAPKRVSSPPPPENEPPKAKRPRHQWNGLRVSMRNPDEQEYVDDRVTVVRDKCPKAKYHFLVMPRENIATLRLVRPKHLPLMWHMHERGRMVADRYAEEGRREFQIGYHAFPSLSPLHLHVISRDFISPTLKTEKHWNSFTTDYFLRSEDVMDHLKRGGMANFMSAKTAKSLLHIPLRCHKCSAPQATMLALKEHLLTHEEERQSEPTDPNKLPSGVNCNSAHSSRVTLSEDRVTNQP